MNCEFQFKSKVGVWNPKHSNVFCASIILLLLVVVWLLYSCLTGASSGLVAIYQWNQWGPWSVCKKLSVCSKTGNKRRWRTCPATEGVKYDKNSVLGCIGATIENFPCPVLTSSTLWEEWTAWSKCSQSCKPGLQSRTRRCTGMSWLNECHHGYIINKFRCFFRNTVNSSLSGLPKKPLKFV